MIHVQIMPKPWTRNEAIFFFLFHVSCIFYSTLMVWRATLRCLKRSKVRGDDKVCRKLHLVAARLRWGRERWKHNGDVCYLFHNVCLCTNHMHRYHFQIIIFFHALITCIDIIFKSLSLIFILWRFKEMKHFNIFSYEIIHLTSYGGKSIWSYLFAVVACLWVAVFHFYSDLLETSKMMMLSWL
jgi:hypothetical protein